MNRFMEMLKRFFSGKKKQTADEQLVDRADELISAGAHKTPEGMMAVIAVFMSDIQRQRAYDRKLKEEEVRWKRIRRATLTFMMLSTAIGAIVMYLYRHGFELPSEKPVSVVSINGEIGLTPGGMADNIIPSLRRAFGNESSKAVILRINSPGGLPVDAERVNRELDALKKKNPKKEVTAVIETVGASAAYMIAVHADKICSGVYSQVGSVGAVVSAWNVSGLAKDLHVTKESFGSGKYKALLDPFAEMTPDAKAKVFSIVNGLGDNFAKEVIANRKERLKLSRDELTTGEIWIGTSALSAGLTDEICTLETVAAKYDAHPKDYGPYISSSSMTDGIARSIGASFFGGMMSAAAQSAFQPK